MVHVLGVYHFSCDSFCCCLGSCYFAAAADISYKILMSIVLFPNYMCSYMYVISRVAHVIHGIQDTILSTSSCFRLTC